MIRAILCLCVALVWATASTAQAVKVTSGEHDGFTRLVLEYGRPVDWQVGRTSDGYELRLRDGARSYDFTGVYDIIGRTRLASVWADPQTGALRIGIGCACHAQPFEFRPGIIVVDLKDGPPPKGSSFELALDGESVDALADRAQPRPRPRPEGSDVAGYDWTAVVRNQRSSGMAPAVEAPRQGLAADAILPTADPALEPLRDALLTQLSRGAAAGVVEMAHPQPASDGPTGTDTVQIRLGEVPGMQIGRDDPNASSLTADGRTCVSDSDLDIASWGTDRPVVQQMADLGSDLIGEFDAPDAEAVARAVKFNLFLTFGAEARQLLVAMPTEQPNGAIWSSMARTLDGEADPSPTFLGMAACDTAAAMWALLSDPPPPVGDVVNRAAALRSFSALPIHLRRVLGPLLAERFVSLNDPAAAKTVRDAIRRAPGDAGPEVAVLEAKLDMSAGEPAAAAAKLEPLIDDSGPATPDALVELVETRVARRQAMDPAQITALEGFLHERRGTAQEQRFARALLLAHATSGDFDSAFKELAGLPEAEPEVWEILAETGPDSAVLAHAILSPEANPISTDLAAAGLARRLSDLGFADAASAWLNRSRSSEAAVSARIALQQRDARAALRLIAGSEDPATQPLRAEALQMLGDEDGLAQVLAESGEDEARWRATARAGKWDQLAEQGPEPWKTVAVLAGVSPQNPEQTPGSEPPGPLERSAALLATSADTRIAVEKLLAAIPPPGVNVP